MEPISYIDKPKLLSPVLKQHIKNENLNKLQLNKEINKEINKQIQQEQINQINKLLVYFKRIQNEFKLIIIDNFLLCIWMFINLISLLINQSIEENYYFNSYNTLISAQLIVVYFISYFYQKFKKVDNEIEGSIEDVGSGGSMDTISNFEKQVRPISRLEMTKIVIPLSFIFVINCMITSKLSENVVEFSKTVVPLTVVGLQYILSKKRYGKTLYYSMIVLVLGTGLFLLDIGNPEEEEITPTNDSTTSTSSWIVIPNFKQFILSLLVISFMSLTLIYSHQIFSTKLKIVDPVKIIYYFSPISFIMLIPFILSEIKSLKLFHQLYSNEKTLNDIYGFIMWVIISGVFSYLTFYITFIANKKYNILVMSISRNSKSILLKLFSSKLVFHDHPIPISFSNWFGFFLSSAGILISYQHSKEEQSEVDIVDKVDISSPDEINK